MNELTYQVKFLSDIVLPASSNTEGNIQQLDFIPGSNFLGMVASKYDKFEDSFNIFHSGNVKFGDASILKDDKLTYKMPLSYFYKKLNNKTIYNHHFLRDSDFKDFGQLKQKRSGFITEDREVIDIDYTYSQKSAYDKENRKSLDKSMYGYSAIKSGTNWQFTIKYDDISKNDLELLKNTILGKKRLGKSKSAQYGLVEITQNGLNKDIEDKTSKDLVIYANSRIALVDEFGNPTYDLKYLFDKLEYKNISYDKCQIKTSTFTPYNGARQTKDYERVCINKGSVIVLKDIPKEDIPNVVGVYQSEGFGALLLNPTFLSEKSFEFKETSEKKETKKVEIKSELARFLKKREEDKHAKLEILNEVESFIETNKSLSNKKMNSQWGQIRSICSNSTNEDIWGNIKEYITHGVAEKKWERKNEKTILRGIESSKTPLEFTKLLSILIPKQKEGNSND